VEGGGLIDGVGCATLALVYALRCEWRCKVILADEAVGERGAVRGGRLRDAR
jgi:hypothetical protein